MKYLIILGAFCLTAINSNAQGFEWAKHIGGPSNDQAKSVATDSEGNVYTTGYFRNTVDFDPGIGTFNLTSAGGYDIYISKLDVSGSFVWAKQLGGTFNDEGFSITTDASGNIYLTGYFQGTADFDPGTEIVNLNASGSYDIFVSKLDASGNFIWAKQLGGSGVDSGYSITIDIGGNVLITGNFRNTADFDPGVETFNLTSVGNRDIFTCKLDASGNFIWAKQTGGISFDNGFSLTTDIFGNVFTTGGFQDTVDFDPGAGVSDLISAGLFDIFISKLNAAGEFLWAKRIGGTRTDNGTSLTTDAAGNIYATGYFRGTLDFNPGAGIFNLISPDDNDIFILKLDASGEFVWVKQMGGTGDDRGFSMASDELGNIYTTGMFKNTADFNPGDGSFNLTSNGDIDIFISKLDASGEFVWALQMGGPDNDFGNDITADETGNIYTTGVFENTVDFDSGAGILNLTSAGGDDAFIHKLNQCPSASSTDVIITCNSYSWLDGNLYSESTNTPTFNIEGGAANGCDSIITLNLTINNTATSTDLIAACGSYTWLDGNLYSESTNTPTFNIEGGAANGCDSLITLNLTINNTANGTDLITACGPYTWLDGNLYSESTNIPTFNIEGGALSGCDSLVTLNLTINNTATSTDLITACDSLTWLDGNLYSESTNIPTFNIEGGAVSGCDSLVTLNLTINNTATSTDLITACDSLTWLDGNLYSESTNTPTFSIEGGAANGCDSIITLDLTINSVSDLSTTTTGSTISASNTNATYQWLDCTDSFSPIDGETNLSFTASITGLYAVELTENGCISNSECVNIIATSILENTFGQDFTSYPNPTSGQVEIVLGKHYADLNVIVRNNLGQELMRKTYVSTNMLKIDLEWGYGIYFIEISGSSHRTILRVLKQ